MIATVFLLAALVASTSAAPAAGELLRHADQARGNLGQQGLEWTLDIATVAEGRTTTMRLRVLAQGLTVMAEVQSPEKSHGQKFFMEKGAMWFHKPGLRKPASVPRRQRLLGDAVTGDIAATDYTTEYRVAQQSREVLNGEKCEVLDLSAAAKSVTYERIRLWISAEKRVGVKAEFFSVSGKRLRTALMEHGHRLSIGGANRPFISQLTIRDEAAGGKVTTIRFSKPALRKFAEGVLSLEKLPDPMPK